jgi:threonine dehydratase
VVCSSAGNHAQGVAFSCAALGIPGHVFLPATTPRQKRERIRARPPAHHRLAERC